MSSGLLLLFYDWYVWIVERSAGASKVVALVMRAACFVSFRVNPDKFEAGFTFGLNNLECSSVCLRVSRFAAFHGNSPLARGRFVSMIRQ